MSKQSIKDYYIELFLSQHKDLLPEATVVDDSSALAMLADNSVGCLVLKEVLNKVLDYSQVIAECKRVLKSQGTLLAVVSTIAPSLDGTENYWGFTVASVKDMFENDFNLERASINHYGNALAGRYLLRDFTADQLTVEQLNQADPFFPLVVGIKAIKENYV